MSFRVEGESGLTLLGKGLEGSSETALFAEPGASVSLGKNEFKESLGP